MGHGIVPPKLHPHTQGGRKNFWWGYLKADAPPLTKTITISSLKQFSDDIHDKGYSILNFALHECHH